MLTDAIENNSAGVIITDNNYKIIYVNKAFEVISGYLKEELLGKDIKMLKSINISDKKYDEILSNLNKGSCYFGEGVKVSRDGREYTEYSQACPVFDEEGKLKYIIMTKLNITKKKMLEKNNT
jgi:PAS domain S-box-containing protein